ncbi:MAG: hypothetical protein PHV37_03435 [Candidatus Gastranaerophilales bacterium]|nr:hypothetical protein [Candidatus Gastranaerophilales bacterium]
MKVYIQPNYAKNSTKQSFTGLTNDLKKKIYENNSEINIVSLKNPKANGTAGTLPPEWMAKIPKEQRQNTIKIFYSEMKDIPETLRKYDYTTRAKKKASKKLTKAFYNAGLIDKKQKLELNERGRGSAGYGYKIDGLNGKTDYIIKVFHTYTDNDRQTGPYIEINRALYWQKNAGHNSNRTNFYFGDLDSGYMVTKFINDKTPKPKHNTNPLLLGLVPRDDGEGNTINGYKIDYGYLDKYGMTLAGDKVYELTGPLAENKNARFAFKKLFESQDKNQTWNNLLTNPKYKNKSDIKAGMVLAIDFMENKEEKYTQMYESLNSIKSAKEADILERALVQKLELAPQNKIADYAKEMMSKRTDLLSTLNYKSQMIKDAKAKEEINKALTSYMRMMGGYQQYGMMY